MRKTSFAIILICLSALWASAQARINVRLAAESKVEGSLLTLGNVAQISGNDEKSQRLKTVSLGYAPNIGMTRELAKDKIVMAISAAGFAPNEVSLDAPPSIRVRRIGQEITQKQLREAAESAVLGQFTENNIEAQIVRLDLPEKIDVPVGKVEITVNGNNARNLYAPFALSMQIRVNDAVVRNLSANIEIEAFTEIFVANKDLAVNSKITEKDFSLENRRISRPLTSYLRDADKLRGLKLIKNISAGSELTMDAFMSDTVVRAGDLVRIVGQAGKMQITVNGEARTSGKIGDRIAVKNTQSNQIIQAIVVDEGLVKVSF